MLYYILLSITLACCMLLLIRLRPTSSKKLALQPSTLPVRSPSKLLDRSQQGLTLFWEEPNRGKARNLYISNRGKRTSTVTGVYWLDEQRFITNHRSGLRVALFDLSLRDTPVCTAELDCLTDDISALKVAKDTWKIVLSGCWDCAYCILQLEMMPTPTFRFLERKENPNRTFSHGCTYGYDGEIWLAYSVGADPRIMKGDKVWRLPKPWGSRKVCMDSKTNEFYAIANNNTPKGRSYNFSSITIWRLNTIKDAWEQIYELSDAHGDALDIYGGYIWIGNQANDTLLGISLEGKQDLQVKCDLSFPHGLAISPNGKIAITNYGNSTIKVLDLSQLIEHSNIASQKSPIMNTPP